MIKIVQRTEIQREGVIYTVTVDGKEMWRKEVAFGFTEYYRPAGEAFRAAAREQEQVAYEQTGRIHPDDRQPIGTEPEPGLSQRDIER